MTPEPVWFDFENTPHVLFLEPIIRRLEEFGIPSIITAKPQSQTLELAEARRLSVTVVGEGNLKGRVRKIVYGLGRAAQLAAWAMRSRRPALLFSSSRSASVAARWLGIPALGLLDYEHAEYRPFAHGCHTVLLPDLLQDALLPRPLTRVARFFEGLKENLYVDDLALDRATIRAEHGIPAGSYLVVARPPATNAHYARQADECAELWGRVVRRVHDEWEATVYVFPRDEEQRSRLDGELGALPRVRVLDRVLEGPALIAAADLVVSAGGTMNREAAALGVPAWSVFTGPAPFIDICLGHEGRLQWVRSDREFNEAWWAGRPRLLERRGPYPGGIETILERIEHHLEIPKHATLRLTKKRPRLTSEVTR